MTTVTGASLLSGTAVQQRYGAYGLSADITNRQQARASFTSSGDTVQISSEARALYRAQFADNATGTLSYNDGDNYQTASSGGSAITYGSGITIQEEVSQVKTEISSLESEIAALEEKAVTDELAAAILRSKLAQLQSMQAKLMGLLAKAYRIE